MIVQIYSLTHPEDVRMLVEMGVDHIGLAPAGQGLRSELSLEECRALFDLLPLARPWCGFDRQDGSGRHRGDGRSGESGDRAHLFGDR